MPKIVPFDPSDEAFEAAERFQRPRPGLTSRLLAAARGTAVFAGAICGLFVIGLDLSAAVAPRAAGLLIEEFRTDVLSDADHRVRTVDWYE